MTPSDYPHRETCGECGGPIARNMLNGRGWLHSNPADWITNPHKATPKEVTS